MSVMFFSPWENNVGNIIVSPFGSNVIHISIYCWENTIGNISVIPLGSNVTNNIVDRWDNNVDNIRVSPFKNNISIHFLSFRSRILFVI